MREWVYCYKIYLTVIPSSIDLLILSFEKNSMLSKNLLGGNCWTKQDQSSAWLCFTSHWSHLLRTNLVPFSDGLSIAHLKSDFVTKKWTFPDMGISGSWGAVWAFSRRFKIRHESDTAALKALFLSIFTRFSFVKPGSAGLLPDLKTYVRVQKLYAGLKRAVKWAVIAVQNTAQTAWNDENDG